MIHRSEAAGYAAALLLILSSTAASGQVVIDGFSDAGPNTIAPPGVQRTTVGVTTVTDTGLTDVIGGARTLTVEATVAGGANPEVLAGVIPSFELLSYSSSLLADGLTTLFYDANGAGLGVDLSTGEGIELGLTTDAAAVPYLVSLTLSDGIITETDVQAGIMSGLTMIQFFYTSFPGVDLSNIDSIELTIDPNAAGDLETADPGIVTFGEPVCGDGVFDLVNNEECDDGNAFDGDGCDNDCTISTACTYTHAGIPAERFVGACGAPSFGSIQAAVSASTTGDFVSVCPGAYIETVVVDQEVTIRSTAGAAVTSVQAGTAATVIFDIRRSGVTIEGLTLTGGMRAIAVDDICPLGLTTCPTLQGSTLTIRDNVITANLVTGIDINRKVDCLAITDNEVSLNTSAGVVVAAQELSSALVSIQGNAISQSLTGLDVAAAGPVLLIAQNTIEAASVQGVRVADLTPGAPANQLIENEIRNNAVGIQVNAGGESLRILQNNITGNTVGLQNEAPGGVVDATLNWWESQTGPFHAIERPLGLGDSIVDVLGFDTAFIEFLCAPAPGGFPSVAGLCDDAEPEEEVQYIAIGHSPDVAPTGRFISFVSAEDINGDDRIGVDNSDMSEEAFLLNRRPIRRPGAFCLGGVNPGASCSSQRDCPADFDADPIVTEGACVLITQISHDPSGTHTTLDPRVTQRGDVVFATDADLTGGNGDNSLEAVLWTHREFRRNEPPNPNMAISEVSVGANVEDSEAPQAARSARNTLFESLADLSGQNADGNREIFVFDSTKNLYTQITNTTLVENRRPATQTGRQVMFDSTADFTGGNADGNREIFFAASRRGGWVIEQMTNTAAPVVNLSGGIGRRGKSVVFSSNGNFTGQNADANREIFLLVKGSFEQITHTTVGENANPVINSRGRFIVFESTADADGPGTTLTNRRIFLFDVNKGTTRAISRSFFGTNAKPRISKGRYVVWESTANLTGSNPGGNRVIYLYNRRKDN
jgi:cysteine-rich repeat protein